MKKIHFMGIGGTGLSSAAIIAKELGYEISGCDFDGKKADVLDKLKEQGIPVSLGHDAAHIAEIDALCVSPAIFDLSNDHPELKNARANNVPILTWQQFMGDELQRNKKVIAVTGTKGKTTTTSFVGLLAEKIELDPIVQVGSDVKAWEQNFRIGSGEWFVCEADEYNNNFHHYRADIAIITNIEMDHPEFFHSYDEYLDSYVEFVRRMKQDSTLILGIDSAGVRDLFPKIDFYHGRVITYGVATNADFRLGDNHTINYSDSFAHFSITRGMDFEIKELSYELHTSLPGVHNILNLMAVFVVGQLFAIKNEVFDAFVDQLELPGRRFEHKGTYHGAILIDDYAHNPMSVRAVIDAAREKYADKNIIAVWQPHMYSRTLTLFDDFVASFDHADRVVILPIYASREKGSVLTEKVSHRSIGEVIQGRLGKEKVQIAEGIDDAIEWLKHNIDEDDVVVNMGAGDNSRVVEAIANL